MILSSIPILLELGMVLSLAGVIILLWTLDDIVAKVVTIFVSLFLGAFAAFTVLPIFSKRCPYWSPTAWACLTIASSTKTLVKSILPFLVFLLLFVQILAANIVSLVKKRGHQCRVWDFRNCTKFWKNRISAIQPPAFTSWRVLDLESISVTEIRAGGRWTKPTDLHAAARLELSREIVNLRRNGKSAAAPRTYDVPSDAVKALLLNIAESSHLIRALFWVQQSSQSTRVAEYIDQSTAEIHSNLPSPVAYGRDGIRMVSNWCILLTDTNHRAPYLALLPGSHGAETHADVSKVTALRQRSGVYYEKSSICFSRTTAMPVKYPHGAAVLARLLMHELQWDFSASRLPADHTLTRAHTPDPAQRRSLELLTTLLSLSEYWTRPFMLQEAALVDQLLGASPRGIAGSDMSQAALQCMSTLFGAAKVLCLEHQIRIGKIRWTSQ